jgi:hypothetical protein
MPSYIYTNTYPPPPPTTTTTTTTTTPGYVFSYYGWYTLIYVASGMMAFNLALFFLAWDMRKLANEHEKPDKHTKNLSYVDDEEDTGSRTTSDYAYGYENETSAATDMGPAFPRMMSTASQHSEEEFSNLANVRTISVA